MRELPEDRVSITASLAHRYFAPERLEVIAGDDGEGLKSSRGRTTVLVGEVAAEIANMWKDDATSRAEEGLKLDTFLGGGKAEGCSREGPRNAETQWVVQGIAADRVATKAMCGLKLGSTGPLPSQIRWLKAFRRINADSFGELYACYARRLRRLGDAKLKKNGNHLLSATPRSVFLTTTQTQAQKYTGVAPGDLAKPVHFDGSMSHLAMAIIAEPPQTKYHQTYGPEISTHNFDSKISEYLFLLQIHISKLNN